MNRLAKDSPLMEDSMKYQAKYLYPNYFYAGFWPRLAAFLIDLAVISAVQSILLDLPLAIFGISLSKENSILYYLLSIAVFLSYFILLTKLSGGQTLGKMILGLRVVSLGKEKLSWSTVLIREGCGRLILKIIPPLYLTMVFNRNRQQMADILCDTSVISEKIFFASEEGFIHRRKQDESYHEPNKEKQVEQNTSFYSQVQNEGIDEKNLDHQHNDNDNTRDLP